MASSSRAWTRCGRNVTLHDARTLDVVASADVHEGLPGSYDHAFACFGAGGEWLVVGHYVLDGRTPTTRMI